MNLIEQRSARRARGRSTTTGTARLGWLDALRALAALTVAVYHLALPFVWIPGGVTLIKHLDPGIFGVMLFFLVSGYIVPASLERRGDVRAFWVGRLFRIHPLVIVVLVVSLLVLPRAHSVVGDYTYAHPLLSLPVNALLLNHFVGIPSAMGVMWTLCYEMVFYCLVSALFAFGKHRHSGPIAVGFAAAALVLGGGFTTGLFGSDHTSVRNLVLAVSVIGAMGLLCVLSGSPALNRTGAALLAVLGLGVVLNNAGAAVFETMMIFATMFAGTVLYRVQHGQIDRMQAALCCGFVVVAGFLVGYMYDHGAALHQTWTAGWHAWSFAYLAVWAVFGAAMLLRNRRFPRVLTWLGAISFSIYLIHIPVVNAMHWLLTGVRPAATVPEKVAQVAVFLAVLFLLSHLAYRLVEVPGQKLGRIVLRLLTGRSPAAPTPPAASGPRLEEGEAAVPAPVLSA
ncbi:acyltransferase [Kitasatospora sp. NPDC002040]|uniref:acyltransferase family protein n=1 Tax=Kitasatospora sp. NPDC002040 TaxID=3154661 RepID=UPI0033327E59